MEIVRHLVVKGEKCPVSRNSIVWLAHMLSPQHCGLSFSVLRVASIAVCASSITGGGQREF